MYIAIERKLVRLCVSVNMRERCGSAYIYMVWDTHFILNIIWHFKSGSELKCETISSVPQCQVWWLIQFHRMSCPFRFVYPEGAPHNTQKLSGIFGRTHSICTNLIIVTISEWSNVWRNVTVVADTTTNWLLLIMVTATIACVVYVHAWNCSSRILICHCCRSIRSCWTRPLHFTLVIIDRVVFTYTGWQKYITCVLLNT